MTATARLPWKVALPFSKAARTIGPIVIGNRFGGGGGELDQLAVLRRGLRRAAAATTHRVSLVHHQAVYNQNEFWVEQVSLTRLWTNEASRAHGAWMTCALRYPPSTRRSAWRSLWTRPARG